MKDTFRKGSLIICFILFILMLNGCSLERDVTSNAVEGMLRSNANTLDFISTNGYNGEDISNVEYTKDENIYKVSFNLKDNIMTSNYVDLSETNKEVGASVIAQPDADIKDVINCAVYSHMTSSRKAEDLHSIFESSIKQAFKNKGQKIEVPIEIDSEQTEIFVQVLDDKIYIKSKVVI
ncbi:hypothetical protein [Senegalia massiliensis]|uniref:Uncharacterized protein n=1 Tax=Senegalia massiliensis TaxID=1720316 RepID=A0A845QX75_9CLOT|nr:hypothetical protein [Senegalia massiliensis]NBI07547.1 hypothetical protein [Senegalia massiliensis]